MCGGTSCRKRVRVCRELLKWGRLGPARSSAAPGRHGGGDFRVLWILAGRRLRRRWPPRAGPGVSRMIARPRAYLPGTPSRRRTLFSPSREWVAALAGASVAAPIAGPSRTRSAPRPTRSRGAAGGATAAAALVRVAGPIRAQCADAADTPGASRGRRPGAPGLQKPTSTRQVLVGLSTRARFPALPTASRPGQAGSWARGRLVLLGVGGRTGHRGPCAGPQPRRVRPGSAGPVSESPPLRRRLHPPGQRPT